MKEKVPRKISYRPFEFLLKHEDVYLRFPSPSIKLLTTISVEGLSLRSFNNGVSTANFI